MLLLPLVRRSGSVAAVLRARLNLRFVAGFAGVGISAFAVLALTSVVGSLSGLLGVPEAQQLAAVAGALLAAVAVYVIFVACWLDRIRARFASNLELRGFHYTLPLLAGELRMAVVAVPRPRPRPSL